MIPADMAHGLGSLIAYALAAISSAQFGLGPDACVPVGAMILLAVASPRDLWQMGRHLAGLDQSGGDGS